MKVIETIAGMKQIRRELKGSVGFVPTMGYLHEGHLELTRRAKTENDIAVVSIFVNPAQFGPKEDYKEYPRDLRKDVALCRKERADYIFYPAVRAMYPEGYSTYVKVEGLTENLCGKFRPAHFRGVTTVVAKLFNIIGPDTAYFGQKDAQQAIVIKRMAGDLETTLRGYRLWGACGGGKKRVVRDSSRCMKKKVEAVLAHASQIDYKSYPQGILGKNNYEAIFWESHEPQKAAFVEIFLDMTEFLEKKDLTLESFIRQDLEAFIRAFI